MHFVRCWNQNQRAPAGRLRTGREMVRVDVRFDVVDDGGGVEEEDGGGGSG